MPLYTINDPYASKWGALGSEFGTGLGEGISQLAQMKLHEVSQQKQQRQMATAYEEAGIPKNIANLLPRVSEKERSTFLSGWAQTQSGQPQAPQQMEQMSPQQARQLNMQQGYQPAAQPQRQQAIQQQLASSARPASVPELLAAISPSGKGLAGVGGAGQPFGPQLAPPPLEVAAEQARAQARQAPQNRIPIQTTQPNFADIYAAGAKTPAERIAEKRAIQKEEEIKLQREKAFRPLLKEIEDKGVPARQTVQIAQDALDLLETNKALTGIKGALTPKQLQTEEGQALMSKLNQLVILKSQLGKGIPSKTRLQLEELSKPAIWQKPRVLKKLLNDIKNDAEIRKDIAEAEAADQIVRESGDFLPKNLNGEIKRRSRDLLRTQEEQSQPNQLTAAMLPPPGKEGSKARNPITNEIEYMVVNGQWQSAKGL
jgi:hypothetical protein